MTVTYIYPPIDSAPSDVYQQFITRMQTLIPGWAPASGNLDDFIAQAMSGIIAQLAEISSDVATAIYRYFGAFIANLPPIAATQAQGLVNFTSSQPAPVGGWQIPANTSMVFTDASGNTQGFHTTTLATISQGATGVNSVPVIADIADSAGNNLTGVAQPVQPFVWLNSITLQAPTTGGADAEDDAAYLSRLRQLYTILTPKPVVADDFSTLALQQPNVGRAVTLDGFDPGPQTVTMTLSSASASATMTSTSTVPVGAPVTGANIPVGSFIQSVPSSAVVVLSSPATGSATNESVTVGGSLQNGGEVTTVVTDPNGNSPPSGTMSAVQSALAAQQLQNFKVNVIAPTYTTVNVAVTLFAWPLQNQANVQAAVQSAIQSFLSGMNWGQPPTGQVTAWFNEPMVRYAALEHIILSVPGVHYIAAMTINGAQQDFPLPGVVPLPQAGTVAVTVNLG